MTGEERDELALAAADVIRASSRNERLATLADVAEALEAIGLAGGQDQPAFDRESLLAALPGILSGCAGVVCFTGVGGGVLYHAPELLSRTYARILDAKGSPVELLAGEIRANSRDYPRPVPSELFEAPPFDLSPEDIALVLKTMAERPGYADITFTTNPSGAVFLFSTLFLERGYAAFLARQAELQALNP